MPIHLICRSAGSCQVAAASSGEVSCDSRRRSSLDGMPGQQPVVDPHITFNTICSKSAARILVMVAMVIGGGFRVNSAAHRLAGLRFPSSRTRTERALNEATRACVSRARQKRIRIKPLKSRDSAIRKQAITGRREILGKDFRHRRGSGKRARYMGSWNVPVKEASHRSGTHPDRRPALQWPR